LLVALALIPEAISFSIIAGVGPGIGLLSCFTTAIVIAVVGGRPAMISAAAGSVALVLAPLIHEHGLKYLTATVILAGVFQVGLGTLGVAKLMRFIPRSVMVGFVNALAILIFLAQVPELENVPWGVYPLVGGALAIIVAFPKLTAVVPAPLVSIVALTALTIGAGIAVPTVGDKGKLPNSLPHFGIPDVPWTLDTLKLIAPTALGVALVGLMESLLTAKLVDDLTDTGSNKTRESIGQGIANVVTGLFGGIAGCAMIGQTIVNVKAGGRTRVSTFLAGAFLLILCIACAPVVARIPMAALVAVMIMVSFVTFDWHSIQPATLKRLPRSETLVMLITVAIVVATNNLAIGVIAGVVVAMVVFARNVAHLAQVSSIIVGDEARYTVTGALFFASCNDLIHQFDYVNDPDAIVINLADAHVWDASAVAALDAVTTKYQAHGKTVDIIGLNAPSADIHHALTGNLSGAG
jgi:SulP family sulfate permease